MEELREERKRREKGNEKLRQMQVERGNKNAAKKERSNSRHTKPRITNVNVGPFLSTAYKQQEQLFHAIDEFLKGIFATRSQKWTAGDHHFLPPANAPYFADAWQLLSNQVGSVSILIERQLYNQANSMLGELLEGVKATAQICDPNFMVHFWTICHVFVGVPARCRGGNLRGSLWLGWFLRNLKESLSAAYTTEHPLIVIVDSILDIWNKSPRDLKPTLGLGHWKATHTLGALIGGAHNIVLNMGVCCTKSWKSKFSASSITVELLYQRLLLASECNIRAEQLAEVYLSYLSAASKEECNGLCAVSDATKLLSWTREICREKAHRHTLEYDSVTRAFVFSSWLVATHHLETVEQTERDYELSYKYMGEAIEILRYGDLQCCIRAASFSGRLSMWIKGHRQKTGKRSKAAAREEEKSKVLEEKVRTREIIRQIPKKRFPGARYKKVIKGVRRNVPREEHALERDLLLASLTR